MSAPFQDNEGRWCHSVHVTQYACAECGAEGFHKHYLNRSELTDEQWRLMMTEIERLAADLAAAQAKINNVLVVCALWGDYSTAAEMIHAALAGEGA